MSEAPERPGVPKPLTSEAAAFRVLVIVIAGAAVVIAAAVVISPAVGAAVLAGEIVGAAWVLLRARAARRS